jgi:DNA polymerase-3 subunit beta
MQFANNQAKFSFGGMEFVTKLVEGKFPDYNRVIPKNHKNSITLGRTAAAGQPAAHRHPDQRQVQGRAPEHRARHAARGQSNNAEQEEAVDELDIDYGGDSIEIGFNVTYLIDALANMEPGHGARSNAGRRQQLGPAHHSRQRHFKYVVMPMRSDA